MRSMQKKNEDKGSVIDKLCQPIPFTREGGEEVELWGCGNCGNIYNEEERARHCYDCAPTECKICGDRLEPRSYCPTCSLARRIANQQEAFEKAEKIEEHAYSDPVFYDGDYYPDAVSFVDYLEDDDIPEWVWASREMQPILDGQEVLEHVEESAGPFDNMDGIQWTDEKELFEFIKSWMSKQTFRWFEEDRTRAIILDRRAIEADRRQT